MILKGVVRKYSGCSGRVHFADGRDEWRVALKVTVAVLQVL